MSTSEEVVVGEPSNVPVRKTIVDASTGVQVVKGGQRYGMSLPEEVVASYTNLVNNSTAMLFLIFLLFVYAAEENDTEGPLEKIQDIINSITNDPDTAQWEKSFARGLSIINRFLIKYKTEFILTGFAWFPYLAKPSTNNVIMSTAHTILIFLMKSTWSFATFFFLSQAHFLYTSVRTPSHKIIILLVTVFALFTDLEIEAKFFGKSKIPSSTSSNPVSSSGYPSSSTPPPAPVFDWFKALKLKNLSPNQISRNITADGTSVLLKNGTEISLQ